MDAVVLCVVLARAFMVGTKLFKNWISKTESEPESGQIVQINICTLSFDPL